MGRIDPIKHKEFVDAMLQFNLIDPMLPFSDKICLSSNINNKTPQYIPGQDIWYLNSKEDKNGNNLYQKLIDRYFFRGINKELFTGNSLNAMCPCLESVPSSDGSQRYLKYNYLFTLLSLASQRRISDDNLRTDESLHMDESELAMRVKSQISSLRNIFSDVARNGNQSLYFEEVRDILARSGLPLTRDNVERNRDLFSNLVNITRNIKINIDENKAITEKEFLECFDIDKFMLMYTKSILDYCKYCDEMYKAKGHERGYLPPCFTVLSQYINSLDVYEMGNDYNPMIKLYDYKERKIKFYTIRELRKEYDRLMAQHKDFLTRFELTTEQAEKMGVVHNMDNMNKLVKLTNEKDADVITTGWDILAPGEVDRVAKPTNGKKNNGTKTPVKVVETEDIIFRRMVFEKTNYAAKIVGKDKFAGYIGYIYDNGVVVFEKFYEDIDRTRVAQSNATYIMKIDNFVKFTKMNKQEIIQFIKDTKSDEIDRLYHSKNWETRLPRLIAGIEYSPEAKMIIDSLIEDSKKNKGKSI